MRTLGFLVAAVAFAQAPPDLRGIWQAQGTAHVNLENAGVIVEPAGGKIPYQSSALQQRKDNFSKRAAADPENRCFQPGVPRAAYLPYPFQISQNAEGVYIVYQRVHAYRVIHLTGRPHNDGLPYAMGDSRGRWEGSALVVDVASFGDRTWFDMAGNFHSDALHVVERYTRADRSAMTYEATIEDPKVFTRSWKIRVPLRIQAGPILEDECEEDAKGIRRHVSPFKN